jgi:ferric-dicitrate binding protein FerR (iron transport regulator)
MRTDGRFWMRAALIPGAVVFADVVLPRLSAPHPAPPPAGRIEDGALLFDRAPLGDVVDALAERTGYPLVLLPQMRARAFTGRLPLDRGGAAAAADLARQTGLVVRRAGPHWLLAPAPAAAATPSG